MTDLADLLVDALRQLTAVRFERDAYRVWFRASIDKLHEQHVENEQLRGQLAAAREELRRRTARHEAEAA